YEMVTGRRAFERRTPAETLSAILDDEPPPPATLDLRASGALQVARRCLEKEPHARFQSCRDIALLLGDRVGSVVPNVAARARSPRRFAAAAILLVTAGVAFGAWLAMGRWPPGHAATVQSIAVLPLENLSHGADDEYFADAMTDALITDLAKVGSLRVVSRTSVMRYKGTRKPLPLIGKELNVDAVLQGSIERAGPQVRISAQLIRAATDEHLWTDAYDRDITNILMLQDEVARSVAR